VSLGQTFMCNQAGAAEVAERASLRGWHLQAMAEQRCDGVAVKAAAFGSEIKQVYLLVLRREERGNWALAMAATDS